MKRFIPIVAGAAAFGFMSAASAADLPVKAPVTKAPVAAVYNWTGFYIGANIGGGWANRDVDFAPNDPPATVFFVPHANGAPTSTSFNTSGVLGGLQVGYNWQFNRNWLVGLETDFDWSGVKGSGVDCCGFAFTPFSLPVAERINWFGTVRARLGYLPADNLLAYVTGGFAYGNVEYTGSLVGSSGLVVGGGTYLARCELGGGPISTCYAGSSHRTVGGWTLGSGFEYAFWRNLTIKAEYLYVSLRGTSTTETTTLLPTDVGLLPSSFNANLGRTTFNVARVGLNYRF